MITLCYEPKENGLPLPWNFQKRYYDY